MSEQVKIKIKEDDSVSKVIQKTAKKLEGKYSKRRSVDVKLLKEKTPLQKALTIISTIFCVLLAILSFILLFSSVISKVTRACPNFAGYSNMKVITPSMTTETIEIDGKIFDSGHEIGEVIVVRQVNTDTLNIGDKIAFYVYPNTYLNFNVSNCEEDEEYRQTEYKAPTFASIFGFHSEQIREAAAKSCSIVFHHIVEIYRDPNGKRWFATRGSSNNQYVNDSWYVSEDMVVGIYDNSDFGRFMAWTIQGISTPTGIIILFLPILLLISIVFAQCVKEVELAKLEYDCVEQKRKITDKVCVKNRIGLRMDEKTKYKILAQAKEEEINEYISLLWKDGTAPTSIRKYYLRKKSLLNYNKKLLELNQTCEEMYRERKNLTEIAQYYILEKEKILTDFQTKQARFQTMKSAVKK